MVLKNDIFGRKLTEYRSFSGIFAVFQEYAPFTASLAGKLLIEKNYLIVANTLGDRLQIIALLALLLVR